MIQKTMDGNIYNFLGDGIEELYWSENDIETEILKTAFKSFQEDDNDDSSFEDYWNERNPQFYIHRVFLEEIYI